MKGAIIAFLHKVMYDSGTLASPSVKMTIKEERHEIMLKLCRRHKNIKTSVS
jgi:hypothetical protein